MVRLGDVCKVTPGFAFKSKDWCEDGVPVLKIRNITGDGSVGVEEVDCVPPAVISSRMDRFKVADGDILLAMTGATAGKVGKLRSKNIFMLNQRVAKLAPVAIDERFFWAVVSSAEYQNRFFRLADGAAQPNMSGGQIEGVEIPLPPEDVQSRVGAILGAYDDLIEVNRRRVAVLEEMARGLFEEWFVRFRFPGHEQVPILATPYGPLPQGWVSQPVGETFEMLGGGTPSKTIEAYWEAGSVDWYTPTDLTGAKTMFMDRSATRITEAGLAKSSAKLFAADSIMMTSRATIGAIAINTGPACTNQGFITCLPNERVPRSYLFYWLHQNVPVFIGHATGATFKEITKGVFKRLPIVVPSSDLAGRFESQVRPMHDMILALERSNRALAASRDLLLPRLISGQLSVEAAERQLEDAA